MQMANKHIPLTLATALLVMLIAGLAGSSLMLLKKMHHRSAHAAAAEVVLDQGRSMVTRLAAQPSITSTNASEADWKEFSRLVRSLNTLEDGLQYVSVMRDGVVVFHEQARRLDGSEPTTALLTSQPVGMRREVLQVGSDSLPVVVFDTSINNTDGTISDVRLALRKDTVNREERAAETAIASMFRLTLLTVIISFAICILLVVWMMRREIKRETMRREQEHLAFSGMLANGIVHDFRNPMSSLRLDVQMLNREAARGDAARPERISSLSERVRNTLDRMDKVFQEFLYVSRPDKNEPTRIDLAACITDALDLLAARFEQSKIQTSLDLPDAPIKVMAYDNSLRRALVNILTNAEQFSPGGSTVTISARENGDKAIVQISDEGPGIPRTMRKNVFDMFVTGRPEGTGLGLFLAKAAIERSLGNVECIESSLTNGACIQITLPLATDRDIQSGTEFAK